MDIGSNKKYGGVHTESSRDIKKQCATYKGMCNKE